MIAKAKVILRGGQNRLPHKALVPGLSLLLLPFRFHPDIFRQQNVYFVIVLELPDSPTLVLQHTRALEMICAGVLLTIVQQILGHAYLNTTSIYLQFSGQEAKSILKDRAII
jgi:integrase